MKLVFAHVETSGLDARKGEVLELTYQTWTDGTKSVVSNDQFCAVGNTEAPSFVEAAKLNGYDHDKRATCPTFRAGFLRKFFAELESAGGALIACGPTLTYEFLTETARRYDLTAPRIFVYDVASMALPLLVAEKVKTLKLADLSELVGKPAPKNSIEKVERTVEVFEKLFVMYYSALMPAAGAK
jgi:hypothetical protein